MSEPKSTGKIILYILLALSLIINIGFIAYLLFGLEKQSPPKIIVQSNDELQRENYEEAKTEKVKEEPGNWFYVREDIKRTKQGKLTAEQKEEIRKLETMGYFAGSKPKPKESNVTVYDPTRACNGFNVYNSGHAPEAILMDMRGNEIHKWKYELEKIIPDFKPPDKEEFNHLYWRRIHLFENGDLLAIFAGYVMIKLDKDSNLIWSYDGIPHHDLFIADNGDIYVLTRIARIDEAYHEKKPIVEDFICILTSSGKEKKCVSILKALENSPYSPMLNNAGKHGNILHANTIEVLDNRLINGSQAFKKGNVLLSLRRLDAVCIVDLDLKSVVWSLSGLWKEQHQPTILDNGRMLVFDNCGKNNKESRVLEIDPFSQQIFWEYASTNENPFFSPNLGTCERLPNGNTLITESNSGRAFEVTPDKKIVWEFINPHQTGKNNELIASIFEVIRLDPEFPLDWAKLPPKKNNN